MKHTALLCLSLLFPAMSTAADSANRFAMKGAGLLPCHVLVTERNKGSDAYYLIAGWVEGYTSAYNKLSPDTYDVLAFESLEMVLLVMNNHCESNADDRLHGVLDSMLSTFADDRVRHESQRVEIVEGERRTHLYRETIRRIQSRLRVLGLYDQDVDGRYTDATRAAIVAFQSDIDFEPTGFPDQATLWRLLRD